MLPFLTLMLLKPQSVFAGFLWVAVGGRGGGSSSGRDLSSQESEGCLDDF